MKRIQKLADLFKEKEVKTMATLRKPVALIGKMAAVSALFLLMLFAGSQTVYAAYDLYIGNTQVTDTNKDNIFGENGADGNPTAWYEPDTLTLHLNGVHIGVDNYHEVEQNSGYGYLNLVSRYSMYAGTDVVRKLVITGDNSFVSAGPEVVYVYNAKEIDEDYTAIDQDGDGKITIEDMTIANVVVAEESGIYFSATGTGTADAFTITGTGTLTSTATDGTAYDWDYYGVDQPDDFFKNPDEGERANKRSVNMGTALTIAGGGWIQMGEPDSNVPTGPRLELTGWDMGANFYSGTSGRFDMEGGTIIAKAMNPTNGTGVNLAGQYNYLDGGTIAGYGTYNADKYGSGAFSQESDFNKGRYNHGMQRVYPETIEGSNSTTKIIAISGWGVVGMTDNAVKADTDAVLVELGLTGSGEPTEPGTNPGTEPTEPSTGEGNHYHTDTLPDSGVDIDVQGFTKAGTVYSVDVEWGAMTFQYEKTTWNAETHKTEPGRGWLVYDNVAEKVINSTQDTINHITVTNHSNADVFATLSYTGIDGYTDITGGFTTKEGDADTRFTAATDTNSAYLTLGTADNNGGVTEGQGKETVGTVYFMPSGIGKTGDVVNEISKWTKIGKITVGILTETPQ